MQSETDKRGSEVPPSTQDRTGQDPSAGRGTDEVTPRSAGRSLLLDWLQTTAAVDVDLPESYDPPPEDVEL